MLIDYLMDMKSAPEMLKPSTDYDRLRSAKAVRFTCTE